MNSLIAAGANVDHQEEKTEYPSSEILDVQVSGTSKSQGRQS
ncbi:hypothetical protein [Wolbachia endosymbiont of Pentidionis agamae]